MCKNLKAHEHHTAHTDRKVSTRTHTCTHTYLHTQVSTHTQSKRKPLSISLSLNRVSIRQTPQTVWLIVSTNTHTHVHAHTHTHTHTHTIMYVLHVCTAAPNTWKINRNVLICMVRTFVRIIKLMYVVCTCMYMYVAIIHTSLSYRYKGR